MQTNHSEWKLTNKNWLSYTLGPNYVMRTLLNATQVTRMWTHYIRAIFYRNRLVSCILSIFVPITIMFWLQTPRMIWTWVLSTNLYNLGTYMCHFMASRWFEMAPLSPVCQIFPTNLLINSTYKRRKPLILIERPVRVILITFSNYSQQIVQILWLNLPKIT